MDLESENSALESVEDNNGLIAQAETIGDKLEDKASIKPVSNSPVEMNSARVAKGFGLRKWRRVKREIVRDPCVNLENSKILKRVLSGAIDPNAKQTHFSGPDVRQDSLGSVGSVNTNNNNMVRLEAGLAFSAGVDSDNSEDRSSKSSTAASVPKVRYEINSGKSRVENSRGERIKIDKENSHSSMESADSRGSNFVFMQGASSSLEQGGTRVMDYNEDNSDHDAHTSSNQKHNLGEEEEEGAEDYSREHSVDESQSKNNGLDPLTEAFNSFQNLEQVLKKELQKFQELGKETISSSLDNGEESSSCIHTGYEGGSEASSSRLFGSKRAGLTSQGSEILNLVNNVEHLEIKLEEAKSIIEVKQVQIRELESNINVSEPRNQGIEIGIEEIFQQKMEAEIEYIVFSRSVSNLKRQIKVMEEEKTLAENEANWTLSKLGEAETKAENLKNQAQGLQNHCVEITENQEVKSFKKRVTKTTSCLLLQLGFLGLLFMQLMPESENVVPT